MPTNKDFNKIVCQRLSEIRQKNNITIEKLAYQSGISKGGLSEIERNMKEPRLYTIAKICSTLNISMKDFFDYPMIEDFLSKIQ